MILYKIDVSNFRNLKNCFFKFDDNVNYLIGENNLGKSNLLDLLTMITQGKSFKERDYNNYLEKIEVKLTFKINDYEFDLFGDDLQSKKPNIIHFSYSQKIDDIYPTVINLSNNEPVSIKTIRKIVYINYQAINSSDNAWKFQHKTDNNDFLKHIIERSENNPDDKIFDLETIKGLKRFLNINLSKIEKFNDFKANPSFSIGPNELMERLINMSNDDPSTPLIINNVKHFATGLNQIVRTILDLYNSKKNPLKKMLVNIDGKKYLHLILALDEPEIHLHPYMQRALISYYKRILSNQEPQFSKLLNFCFGIDGIIGQLIITTHSSDSLVDGYKNLIRFYRNNDDETKIANGASVNLKADTQKHLAMHFPDIIDAFYSKCVLIVEGETEYGCIPYLAKNINVSLDDLGISFINARGEGSIAKIQELFEKFEIPTIAIYDGDAKDYLNKSAFKNRNIFFTQSLCFELEILDNLIHEQKFDVIKKIASNYDPSMFNTSMNNFFVSKGFKKLNLAMKNYKKTSLDKLDPSNLENYRNIYFAWFYRKKGYLLGKLIGQNLTDENCIPTSYKEAILCAKEIALGNFQKQKKNKKNSS